METKFPKGILEQSFVSHNHFVLNKDAQRVEEDLTRNANVQAGSSRDAGSSSYYDYGYGYYNYDYIWWLYLCDMNYGYYPISFYHRNYFYSGDASGGGDGGISICTAGEISAGGGTVGEDGGAFDGGEPIGIDGGDGGEQFGAMDDGAGHDEIVDGGDGDGGDGGGDGE